MSSEPLNSLKLFIPSTETKAISASVHVSGGAPYTCSLNYGDSSANAEFTSSTDRVLSKVFNYEYKSSGIFQVTLMCQSKALQQSVLTDTRLVYVKENAVSTELDNFKQYYLLNSQSSVSLELPFKTCSQGLKLQVFDKFSDKKLIDWECHQVRIFVL